MFQYCSEALKKIWFDYCFCYEQFLTVMHNVFTGVDIFTRGVIFFAASAPNYRQKNMVCRHFSAFNIYSANKLKSKFYF